MEKSEDANVGANERMPEPSICATPLTVPIGPSSPTASTRITCNAPEGVITIWSRKLHVRRWNLTVCHIDHCLESELHENARRHIAIQASRSPSEIARDGVHKEAEE